MPRPWVWWFGEEYPPSAGHTTFGSEFYDGSAVGQTLVQGSSVPGSKAEWLDGSYRAAASACQGPWLSGRARYWTEGHCPDHTGAYRDVIRARIWAAVPGSLPYRSQESDWFLIRRGPDPNLWQGEAWLYGYGGSQRVLFQFICPGGLSLGCSYAVAGVVLETSGDPDPLFNPFFNLPWTDPREGLQSWVDPSNPVNFGGDFNFDYQGT